MLGLYIIRQEGLQVLGNLKNTVDRGESPVSELIHGFFLAIAGFFFLLPGRDVRNESGFFLGFDFEGVRNTLGVDRGAGAEDFRRRIFGGPMTSVFFFVAFDDFFDSEASIGGPSASRGF